MDLPLVPLPVPGESEKTVLRLNGLPFPEPPDDCVVLVLVQNLEAAQRLVRPVAEAVERMGPGSSAKRTMPVRAVEEHSLCMPVLMSSMETPSE